MQNLIKYSFLTVDEGGGPVLKLPSKILPIGTIIPGMDILFDTGDYYKITSVVLDLEMPEPEMHVELLKK